MSGDDERKVGSSTPVHGVQLRSAYPLPERVSFLENDLELFRADMRYAFEKLDDRLKLGSNTMTKHEGRLDSLDSKISREVVAVEAKFEASIGKLEGHITEQFKQVGLGLEKLKPQPASRLQLFGALFGSVIFVGGLVWAASRYPERGEFNGLAESVRTVRDEMRDQRNDNKRRDDKLDDIIGRLRHLEEKKSP